MGFPELERVFRGTVSFNSFQLNIPHIISSCLVENDVSGEILAELNHEALKEMGVLSLGKRARLIKLISEFKTRKSPASRGAPPTRHKTQSLSDVPSGFATPKGGRS